MTAAQTPRTVIERHVERIPFSGCWIWMRSLNSRGYGQAWNGKKTVLAHRLSYSAYFGVIDNGMHVCHRCDTPSCVNPDHLFLGDDRANLIDCINKGRRGKISKQQFLEIKKRLASGQSRRSLAKELGIHHSAITWRLKHE